MWLIDYANVMNSQKKPLMQCADVGCRRFWAIRRKIAAKGLFLRHAFYLSHALKGMLKYAQLEPSAYRRGFREWRVTLNGSGPPGPLRESVGIGKQLHLLEEMQAGVWMILCVYVRYNSMIVGITSFVLHHRWLCFDCHGAAVVLERWIYINGQLTPKLRRRDWLEIAMFQIEATNSSTIFFPAYSSKDLWKRL